MDAERAALERRAAELRLALERRVPPAVSFAPLSPAAEHPADKSGVRFVPLPGKGVERGGSDATLGCGHEGPGGGGCWGCHWAGAGFTRAAAPDAKAADHMDGDEDNEDEETEAEAEQDADPMPAGWRPPEMVRRFPLGAPITRSHSFPVASLRPQRLPPAGRSILRTASGGLPGREGRRVRFDGAVVVFGEPS